MKFSEFPYKRIDLEATKKELALIVEEFKNATSYEEERKAFLKLEDLEVETQTVSTLAEVRHTIDNNDKFYSDEQDFWDQAGPELEEYVQNFFLLMLNSKYRKNFEEEFGKTFLLNAELSVKAFSPEIIPDMQKENALVNEYNKIVATGKIPFEGKDYTSAQMEPFKADKDDTRRLSAWKAHGKFFKDNKVELDRIYDELVQLRDSMGRKLGYDGYTELGYLRMQRNCYDKKDVEKFREAVVKYVVPLASKLYEDQAKRLGKTYPMNASDNNLSFRSGNPKPLGTPEDIVNAAKTFYHELSPETDKFFNMMIDMELMDLVAKEGKEVGGYCTAFPKYKVPFIFSNFNGTQGDVEVVTHEAGHAFQMYTCRDIFPIECAFPSLESCEVHSMSMEFFAWPWSKNFFGPDTDKFHYSHLASALQFIPYGTMVDHFQHIVYEKPNMTPDERHAEWKKLCGIYQPWMKLDSEIPFYGDGMYWQRQLHIYQTPFYYIDYCLAQTVALEFWALTQKDFSGAWEKYMTYTKMGGTETFKDLLKKSDLVSPFDGDCLKEVCEVASKWLDAFDQEKLK